jgi:hypothetical protein
VYEPQILLWVAKPTAKLADALKPRLAKAPANTVYIFESLVVIHLFILLILQSGILDIMY